MAKRSLAILTLASLLFLNFGVVDALHLGHDHNHDHGADTSHCQVCYLVKVATVGVAVSVALFVVFSGEPETEPMLMPTRPLRVGRGAPKCPRAPPVC
ncbi:MAG: hypothetical protein H6819_00350 [Phycisphaerales bacterium]|nr:hypothetical protein [Phycisphaerales bacterium]MCB9857341.1 hypothetical protein [Phycisphaerales bacterium]